MDVVHPVCAGIDVHKRSVSVCLLQEQHEEHREFGTATRELLQLADFLRQHQCPTVAMESTGVFWKPLFNVLEEYCQVVLINPCDAKRYGDPKTDRLDARRLAQLHKHGLLRASFIPPVEIRDLRDLTRYRKKLVEQRASEILRVQKLLEDANIKLSSVATDVLGVSGRCMLNAIVEGERDPLKLAELARGRLMEKKEQLRAALEGRIREHHVTLLRQILSHIDFLSESIKEVERETDELFRPFAEEVALAETVPGVATRAAQAILAETGVKMEQFPSEKHICSWAGISPNAKESGGKRQNSHLGFGNKMLRCVLAECAYAASRSKGNYLKAQYYRFAKRKGRKHATMVVAHSILSIIYQILSKHQEYRDLGEDYFARLNRNVLTERCVHQLHQLGYEAVLTPLDPTRAT